MFGEQAVPGLSWGIFGAIVLGLLALDLGVFHRHAHTVTFREAALWSFLWVTVSLLFGAWVWLTFGEGKGLEFLTAYLIEKSLSVDNIFVFVAIFSFFHVEAQLQHRVLFWGILGALVFRALFIFAGLALIHQFHWLIYLMGLFLVVTGIRFLKQQEGIHPEWNPVVRLFKRIFPVTSDYRGEAFLVREGGKWLATPLLIVLIVVETSDLMFAVDSIPAVLAVSMDPFIVYTSNVFAILGLRALYFVLAGLIPKFRYLRFGLCGILVFVGIKMLVSDWLHVPIGLSLGVIGGILLVAMLASLKKTPKGV